MKNFKLLKHNLLENKSARILPFALAAVIGLFFVRDARAASQTWTNAPVDATWINTNNWIGQAVPGAINGTGNTPSADTATFTNAIFSGIGGAANPITPDNATISGDRARSVLGITFDGPNCGAYVFNSPSAAAQPSTGVLWVGHNGAIRMNAPVTNTETFLLPIYVILPSSTAGIFNLVNNSTNPNAALIISSLTHGGATTRATTFILDGTNTANNIITNLSENTGNATGGFTKQGPGTWTLAGPGTFPAASPMNINQGTLIVQDPGAFGVASGVTVNSNGVLQVNGVALTTGVITNQRSGTVRANGSSTVNGITVGTVAAGTSPTLATTSSADVFTVGTAANKVTGGASDSTIHVAGPGSVYLGNDNNYLGKWSVDAGTLSVASANALGTGLNVNVSAGATLDVSPLGGTSWNPSTTGLGGSGTGTTSLIAATVKADPAGTIDLATGSKAVNLAFTPTAFTGDSAHPALYISQGTLALGGNAFSISNASATPLGTGIYLLIKQASGNITDGGNYSVVGVTGGGVAAGNVASVAVSGGNLNLVVSPYTAKNLVWTGGNPDTTWSVNNPGNTNWLNGASHSVFNNSDNVTFNSVGSTNPTVNLPGAVSPASLTVDTISNSYTFSGAGQIAGATSLVKKSGGTLVLQTVNGYSGGTVISNGVIQLGVNNAVPSVGAGDVTVYSPGILDLNGFNDSIDGLIGNGTVDNVSAGGAPVLTFGNNDNNGTFSGVVQNTSGTIGLTKVGVGAETLSGSNTYSGPTLISAGSLKVGNINALGSGTSAVTVSGGTLDLMTNANVTTIAGAGTVANNSTATTNTLIVLNTSTFGGIIMDGSGGGKIAVSVKGGTLRLNGANTYSGGTFLTTGSGLAFGNGNASGSGSVIASNATTLSIPVSTIGVAGTITTADGATASFTSGNTANSWGNQFTGSATATNVFTGGNVTISGQNGFGGFLGTVIVTNGTVRVGLGNTGPFGGTNTTFNFVGTGGMYLRDANGIDILGALTGNGVITAPTTAPGNFWIGSKGVDSTFEGTITGGNNIVKTGTARLAFDGLTATTNTDNSTYTNLIYGTASQLTYTGATTISNGVLALVVPNNLNTSPTITLAGATAVLDASSMGSVSNFNDINGNASSALVTNGVFEVLSSQTLTGLGILRGSLLTDAGSTFNVGLPLGNFITTNTVELAGAVNMSVNVTNAPNASALQAKSFTIDGSAALVVTNLGSQNAATFQLFNHPVNFPSVTLPTLSGTNSWVNNLAVDGSIKLLAPALVTVATNPTNITAVAGGGTLSLTWPGDHLGWTLQTNSVGLTSTNSWFPYPGSASVTNVIISISPTQPSVFFRLVYP
jgi:autotransporter-associated beta strand protein